MQANTSNTASAVCYVNLQNLTRPNCTRQSRMPTLYNPCTMQCYTGYHLYQFDEVYSKPSSIFTYGTIYPFLVVITVLSNIFIAIVLSKRHMKTPTNLVLLYMAYADLAVALVPFPFLFFFNILGFYKHKYSLKVWWCYAAMYTTDSLPPLCHNVAIWLTVLLATQRYACIRFPISGVRFCNVPFLKRMSVVILAVSCLCSLPKIFSIVQFDMLSFEMYHAANRSLISKMHKCMFKYSGIVDMVGLGYFFSTFYWTRVVLFVTIPSVLLLIFSILLMKEIRASYKRGEKLRSQRKADRQQEKYNTNVMLLLIVAIFLVVNLPQGIILATFSVSQAIGWRHLNKELILITTNIDNMLILATYPINFAIYCCMSSSFRATFKQLFQKPITTGPFRLMNRLRSIKANRTGCNPPPRVDVEETLLPLNGVDPEFCEISTRVHCMPLTTTDLDNHDY